jgi:hypothetical protein
MTSPVRIASDNFIRNVPNTKILAGFLSVNFAMNEKIPTVYPAKGSALG